MRFARALPLAFLLLATAISPAVAQSSWHIGIAVGMEASSLPNTFHALSGPMATPGKPGTAIQASFGYQPPQSRWGIELRGLRVYRSRNLSDACLSLAPSNCSLESLTKVTGVGLTSRYELLSGGWLRPYLSGGVGLYRVYNSDPVREIRTGDRLVTVERETHEGTEPALLGAVGLRMGGALQVFIEVSAQRYLSGSAPSYSLPIVAGFRL